MQREVTIGPDGGEAVKMEHIRAARMVDACVNALALAVQHAQHDLRAGPLQVTLTLGPSTDLSNMRAVKVKLGEHENDGPLWMFETALSEVLEKREAAIKAEAWAARREREAAYVEGNLSLSEALKP